jgi:alpha-glucosidase
MFTTFRNPFSRFNEVSFLQKMLSMKTILFLLTTAVWMVLACNQPPTIITNVQSPDGNIRVIVETVENSLSYQVVHKGDTIISRSALGFALKDKEPLGANMVITDSRSRSYDNTWEQPWGEQRLIREHYNELMLTLREASGQKRKMQIIFRVFDDGVGFRYFIPEQDNLQDFQIMDELTEFNFTANHNAWWIKAYQPERYEYLYRRTTLNEIDSFAHTPLTIETLNGKFLSIHEAELTDYASMALQPTGNNGLKCNLAPLSDGVLVNARTPFQTPWRSIIIAEKPGDLITSYLSLNLNPPNQLGDVSWVKPMKYVGIWWGIHIGHWTFGLTEKHGATTERAKQYIDFAEKNGFQEVLVEGWNLGWKTTPDWYLDDGRDISFTKCTPDYDIEEVQRYAQTKGVTLQIYFETMANTKNFLSQIDSSFALAQRLGIRSAKIGQVGSRLDRKEFHHSQYGVNYYREVLKKAALYKLGVNFHEPIKDTGERRTFPNMLSREGARGTEYDAWSGDGGNPPAHTCILPFTRLLAGPMDFTPGIFELTIPHRPNNQVNTTLAKQLAFYIVIYSPIQMAADLVEHYEDQPAFQFIKDVPVDWETTKVIDASIGNYLIVVRKDRFSDDWYLGAITNEEAREFTIQLDFLDNEQPYIAQIYADAQDADYQSKPAAYTIQERQVRKAEQFTIKLARGGGIAVRFKAAQ